MPTDYTTVHLIEKNGGRGLAFQADSLYAGTAGQGILRLPLR